MALREQYLDGSLQNSLQQFLVNEEIKQLTGGEEVILTVHIDEQEFNDAMLDLMMERQSKYLVKSNLSQIWGFIQVYKLMKIMHLYCIIIFEWIF